MKASVCFLMIAGLIAAASPLQAREDVERRSVQAAAAPDPAEQLLDLARMLRANDLHGMLRASVPPRHYQELRLAYEVQRLEPSSESDRNEFAEHLGKLNAPDAVEQLMAEIEPKLAEARPKAPAAIMMGLGALQIALMSEDNKLSPEQRESLQNALPGFQSWVTRTDFLSSQSMRQALSLIAGAVQSTGIQDLDQLKQWSFEQTLAQAGRVLAAGKQALLIYGLDPDAIADSLRVEVLAVEGDRARVRSTISLFDAPISAEHELVLLDGRWYAKDFAKHWTIHHDKQAQR